MTESTVSLVEARGVKPVHAMDAGREAVALGFDHEVVVRPHQAKRVKGPGVMAHRVFEQTQEVPAVVVIEKEEPGRCHGAGIHVEVAMGGRLERGTRAMSRS